MAGALAMTRAQSLCYHCACSNSDVILLSDPRIG